MLNRARDIQDFVPVHTSELQRNNKNEGIEWKEFRISVNSLCRGDEHKLIKVEFLEVRKGKANRKKLKINFVGEAEFSMREVAFDGVTEFRIINKRLQIGTMVVSKFDFITK